MVVHHLVSSLSLVVVVWPFGCTLVMLNPSPKIPKSIIIYVCLAVKTSMNACISSKHVACRSLRATNVSIATFSSSSTLLCSFSDEPILAFFALVFWLPWTSGTTVAMTLRPIVKVPGWISTELAENKKENREKVCWERENSLSMFYIIPDQLTNLVHKGMSSLI